MSPGLALRVAILGGIALVMFAIVFFRLWYLQVLSGDHYLAQADNNRVRSIKLPAPRGKIVDRNGHTLVDSRAANVVEVAPDQLPKTNAEIGGLTLLSLRSKRLLKPPPGISVATPNTITTLLLSSGRYS